MLVAGLAEVCLQDNLARFKVDAEEFNVNIQHVPLQEKEKAYVPYIGNGMFGLTLDANSPVYIRNGRCLSQPVYWQPNIDASFRASESQEAVLLHYVDGVAYKYQCFSNGLSVISEYYAHRRLPMLLVQNVRLTNPTDAVLLVELQRLETNNWATSSSQVIKYGLKN
ncbi:hypothetical protein PR048_014058 [Dryococelus australis]|uniref:Uncharacterized protein n=1 Tax=Dryococelus australis TaxID=614101 RepID=A0ABQ9HU75_9NEOP|nr:hypothetical protein PR048_014058 [Dryococelus australis]